MKKIRVKVCGVTNKEELKTVEDSGADAVGFLVGQKHNAVGFISAQEAGDLVKEASPFISTVMVTHIEDINDLLILATIVNPDVIQLHNNLSSRKISELRDNLPHIKLVGKVSVTDAAAIDRALEIDGIVDAILLDSIDLSNDRVGGTGTTHDWNISRTIVDSVSSPVILAGGLGPDNVLEAVKQVKPWGVDANSRLKPNGQKDPDLVAKFVQNAKARF